MTTDERLRELERRLAQAEETITKLDRQASLVKEGVSLPLPVRLRNDRGVVVIELSGDTDGGCLYIRDGKGNQRVTLGCGPDGGWLDITEAGRERLSLTLMATDEGGSIELTRNDGAYLVQAERYYSEDTGMV